jgi:hypothetical protein
MCGYFACGAATIVYNGSPMYPDTAQLLRIISKYKVTYFGTSPRYLLEVQMANVVPKERFDLSSLRIVYTTGATLSPEQYRWFYRAFPGHVHLCNTAGGTDTATSLVAADPTSPIYAGEMYVRSPHHSKHLQRFLLISYRQIFALGMAVDIADPTTGASILDSGEAGEMIVRKPFPSMPCFFWGDTDGSRYKSSYFERFEGIDVWAQHDWLQKIPGTGGLVMHGRSDGVLSEFDARSDCPSHDDCCADLNCRPIRYPFRLRRGMSHHFLPTNPPKLTNILLQDLRHSRIPTLHNLNQQHPLRRPPPPTRLRRIRLPLPRHGARCPFHATTLRFHQSRYSERIESEACAAVRDPGAGDSGDD